MNCPAPPPSDKDLKASLCGINSSQEIEGLLRRSFGYPRRRRRGGSWQQPPQPGVTSGPAYMQQLNLLDALGAALQGTQCVQQQQQQPMDACALQPVVPAAAAAAAAAIAPSAGVPAHPGTQEPPGQWWPFLTPPTLGLYPFGMMMNLQYAQCVQGATATAAATAAAPLAIGRKNNNTNEQMGRPPTFDDMVQWCIDLRRLLWQRCGRLINLDEAVMQVNTHFPVMLYIHKDGREEKRELVKSTLRKRVR